MVRPGQVLLLVVVNLAVVAGLTLAIGASAPRWPDAWVARDRGPLRLASWETVARYRRLGVQRWARRLPELGGLFGIDKRHLRGRSPELLAAYLLEVRRAEWVHWASLLALLPIAVFNPWWLWLLFAVISCAVNLPFWAILRLNRIRLAGLLGRRERRRN